MESNVLDQEIHAFEHRGGIDRIRGRDLGGAGHMLAYREGTGDDSFADLFGHLPEQGRRSRKIESHPTPPAA